MAAILMTSLLGPDAELRWANWLKLLQIPQSLILYRSPKIVTKFTRDHCFGPFDIDYKHETERPTSLVHTKNEPGWWVQKAFKHVQTAYAQCCDAAQALRAWIGGLKITNN